MIYGRSRQHVHNFIYRFQIYLFDIHWKNFVGKIYSIFLLLQVDDTVNIIFKNDLYGVGD